MLLRWSFRTSKLSSPWNVRPSIRRMRFRFSSLKSPRPYKFIKSQSFLTKSSVQHTMGTAMPTAPLSTVPRREQKFAGNFQSQTYPGKPAGCDPLNKLTLRQTHYREIRETVRQFLFIPPLSAFILSHLSFSSVFTLHLLSSRDSIWTNTVKTSALFLLQPIGFIGLVITQQKCALKWVP